MNKNIKKTYLEVPYEIIQKNLYNQINLGTQLKDKMLSANELKEVTEEFAIWVDTTSELLKQSFDNPKNEYLRDFSQAGVNVILYGNIDPKNDRIEELDKKILVLKSISSKIKLIPLSSQIQPVQCTNALSETTNNKKIFIVHGHNQTLKEEVSNFLKVFNLNPIILHKQANRGSTIIEKFESNANQSSFAIILLTADDLALTEEDFDDCQTTSQLRAKCRKRARQNVIFEMGYFIGKLGRKNVCLLLEDTVEKPGDLDGIVYIPIEDEYKWKLSLAQQLKSANFDVDLNLIIEE